MTASTADLLRSLLRQAHAEADRRKFPAAIRRRLLEAIPAIDELEDK